MKIDPDPAAESEVKMISLCPRHSMNEKAAAEEVKPDKLKVSKYCLTFTAVQNLYLVRRTEGPGT